MPHGNTNGAQPKRRFDSHLGSKPQRPACSLPDRNYVSNDHRQATPFLRQFAFRSVLQCLIKRKSLSPSQSKAEIKACHWKSCFKRKIKVSCSMEPSKAVGSVVSCKDSTHWNCQRFHFSISSTSCFNSFDFFDSVLPSSLGNLR